MAKYVETVLCERILIFKNQLCFSDRDHSILFSCMKSLSSVGCLSVIKSLDPGFSFSWIWRKNKFKKSCDDNFCGTGNFVDNFSFPPRKKSSVISREKKLPVLNGYLVFQVLVLNSDLDLDSIISCTLLEVFKFWMCCQLSSNH